MYIFVRTGSRSTDQVACKASVKRTCGFMDLWLFVFIVVLLNISFMWLSHLFHTTKSLVSGSRAACFKVSMSTETAHRRETAKRETFSTVIVVCHWRSLSNIINVLHVSKRN